MKSHIQVGVRVRPPIPKEIQHGQYHKCIALQNAASGDKDSKVYISMSGKPLIITAGMESNDSELAIYTFKKIFDTDSTQESIYSSMIQPAVKSVVDQGVNACVFAYGQTGSGKTYTMYGSGEKAGKQVSQMTEEEIREFQGFGMAQRAVIEVFEKLRGKEQHGGADQEQVLIEESKVEEDDQIQEEQAPDDCEVDSDGTETTIGDVERNVSIFVSIYQIYNENVNDLIGKSGSTLKNLQMRQDSRKKFYLQGISQVLVKSPKDVFTLIKKALSNRAAASTGMNELSSRSHLILQMTINQIDERDMSATVSKLNIVDLAGSERVKDSEVSGKQLLEAANINKSLFHLISVVNDLKEGKQPNYRNSALTKLLSDSIGGNCMTTLLAMVSPSLQFSKESNNTLAFANSCSQVSNVVKPNKYKNTIPSSVPVTLKKKVAKVQLPWQQGLDHKGILAQCEEVTLKLKDFGDLYLLKAGEEGWKEKIILIHGCPSSSTAFLHQIPAFLFCQYQVFAIDLPGYGKSTGKKQPSKSSEVHSKGGPAELVKALVAALGLDSKETNLCIGGYDWGAAIALKMGLKNEKMFKKIIAFHPSYNEDTKDELKNLKLPTLIQWVKQDQLHPWNKWQPLAKKIPNATVDVVDIGTFKSESSSCTYEKFSDKVTSAVVKFLTGVDYMNPTKEVFQAKKEKGMDTKGKAITQIDTLILQDDLSAQQIEAMTQKPDAAKEAVSALAKIVQRQGFTQLLASRTNKSHPERENFKRLIGSLPDFDMDSEDPTQFLVDYGIWSQSPQNLESMLESPRYFPGRRQVLAKYFVQSAIPKDKNKYMKLCPAEQSPSNERFVTHRASIVDCRGNEVTIVDPEDPEGEKYVVPLDELKKLNQPHVFAKDILGNLVFEDGLKCSYQKTNTKLILYQIAVALGPLIQQLDFATDDLQTIQSNLQVQLECVRVIRKCLNIITFNKGDQKQVVAEREKTGDVGLTALFGQGNCHGCASTMAAYLYPFQRVLGIDLKYRGGYSFHSDAHLAVKNEVERHQWLEITCRPSMETFLCDLWYEGVNDDADYLTLPIDTAYSEVMYPNGNLILSSKSAKGSATDVKESQARDDVADRRTCNEEPMEIDQIAS